jgi:hypothetical protein
MPAGGNHSATHSQVRGTIVEYLFARGGCALPLLGGLGIRRGSPDIIGAIGGRSLAIEVKTGAAVCTARQLYEQGRWRRGGALVLVVHSVDEVEAALLDAGLVDAPALLSFTAVRPGKGDGA